MNKEKWIEVLVYCDSTDLFNEQECEKNNLCYMMFPENIVKEWYKINENDNKEQTSIELNKKYNSCTFKDWIKNVYTADDTDGLYWFTVNKGYNPYL